MSLGEAALGELALGELPSAGSLQSVTVTGLTANTTYYIHYVQDDAASNESNVVSSASFTTDAAGAVLMGSLHKMQYRHILTR